MDADKKTLQEKLNQISTTLDATGDIRLESDKNIIALGGHAKSSTGSVFMKAGDEIALLAATDISVYNTEKKNGHFLSQRKTTTSTLETTVHGFQISTGAEGGINLESKNNITLQSSDLSAGSGGIRAHAEEGKILFDIAQESTSYSRNSSNNMIVWERTHDRGTSADSGVETRINTSGPIDLQAAQGIEYRYAQRRDESAADALARTQGQAWVADLQNRETINWAGITDTDRSWDKSHSGLAPLGAIIVSAVVAYFTYGAVSGVVGTTTGGVAVSAGAAASASSIAVQLGTTGSVNWSDVLKTSIVAAATAGVVNANLFNGKSLNDLAGITTSGTGTQAVKGISYTGDNLIGIVGRNTVSAGLSSIVQGGSFANGFVTGMIGDFGAQGAKDIGAAWGNGNDPVLQTLAHMGLGGLIAGAQGEDVMAGVIGGGVESVYSNIFGKPLAGSTFGDIAYISGAMFAGGFAAQLAGHDPTIAAQIAQNAAQNNYLYHHEAQELDEAKDQLRRCQDETCRSQYQSTIDRLNAEDLKRHQDFESACNNPSSGACSDAYKELKKAAESYAGNTTESVLTVIGRKQSDVQQLVDRYGLRIGTDNLINLADGAASVVVERAINTITGVVDMATLLGLAATNDPYALSVLGALVSDSKDAIINVLTTDPSITIGSAVDNARTEIINSLEEADRLEAAGRKDEAQQLRGRMALEQYFTVSDSVLMIGATGSMIKGIGKKADDVNLPNTGITGKKEPAPGLERPFRDPNPDFPPNQAVMDKIQTPEIQRMVKETGCSDCSEIAEKLYHAANGKGEILEVRPKQNGNLTLYENGEMKEKMYYHQIYTDGQYVYDPRLSNQPIPKGDWEIHIRGINNDTVYITNKPQGLK